MEFEKIENYSWLKKIREHLGDVPPKTIVEVAYPTSTEGFKPFYSDPSREGKVLVLPENEIKERFLKALPKFEFLPDLKNSEWFFNPLTTDDDAYCYTICPVIRVKIEHLHYTISYKFYIDEDAVYNDRRYCEDDNYCITYSDAAQLFLSSRITSPIYDAPQKIDYKKIVEHLSEIPHIFFDVEEGYNDYGKTIREQITERAMSGYSARGMGWQKGKIKIFPFALICEGEIKCNIVSSIIVNYYTDNSVGYEINEVW